MTQTVRITETYDLKTSVNKLGLIGIHTPTARLIKQLYPGLVKNHKFIRLVKCDVVGACASVLPADPLQVGVSSGDIAPEDMFNPILYKPVSNEAFDTLVNRIYGQSDVSTLSSVTKGDLSSDAFNTYYSLLSESKKWKKAMPQRGFGMRGLYPICYTMVNTYGNQHLINQKLDIPVSEDTVEMSNPDGVNIPDSTLTPSGTTLTQYGVTFKGKSIRMPRIPIHYQPEPYNDYPGDLQIPKTFVMALLTPPARLHEFYYRMRVTWTIRFEGLCSTLEYANAGTFSLIGGYAHATSYGSSKDLAGAEASLDNKSETVDANDVSINKIMES